MNADRPRHPDRFDLLLALLPYTLVCLSLLSFVPVWDAAGYMTCLVGAFVGPHGLGALNCADHPTGGYFGLLALPFRLAGLHYGGVIVGNLCLGALAAHRVTDLSALLCPGEEHRAERAVLVLGLTLSPLFVACTVQLTPDFGVAVFTLCAIRAMARERLWETALFGALMCFSKETGAVIYALCTAAYLLVYVGWSTGTPRARLRSLLRHSALALALVPTVLWLAWRLLNLGDRAVWRGGGMTTPLWRQLLTVSWLDNVFPSQLAEIFVLNFAWVLSTFVLLHALQGLSHWIQGAPARDLSRPDARAARFFALAALATVFAVTRVRTFVIPRYVLPATVLVPLLGQLALHALGVQRRLRLLVLGLFASVSALGIFASQDGLSLRAFDSFRFGAHPIIDVTGWTHEYPNRRDHLVYNLEFTEVARVLDEALPFALADGRHALALNRHADWWLINCVDRRTHHRVVCTRGTFSPRVWTLAAVEHERVLPALVYYLEQPGMDDDDELIAWRQRYYVGAARLFSHHGYSIGVRELRLRDATPPSR